VLKAAARSHGSSTGAATERTGRAPPKPTTCARVTRQGRRARRVQPGHRPGLTGPQRVNAHLDPRGRAPVRDAQLAGLPGLRICRARWRGRRRRVPLGSRRIPAREHAEFSAGHLMGELPCKAGCTPRAPDGTGPAVIEALAQDFVGPRVRARVVLQEHDRAASVRRVLDRDYPYVPIALQRRLFWAREHLIHGPTLGRENRGVQGRRVEALAGQSETRGRREFGASRMPKVCSGLSRLRLLRDPATGRGRAGRRR
jgi:hypothetical protein